LVTRFKCLMRGEICCFFRDYEEMPVVFPWEKRKLEKLSSLINKDLMFKPYIIYSVGNKNIVVLYKWMINGLCPFLKNNKCSIHEYKPLACQMYPLLVGWDDNTLRVSLECPWIKDNIDKVKRLDPAKVFEKEYSVAVKVFLILKIIEEYARRNNWVKRVIGKEEEVNNYIEITDVLENIVDLMEKFEMQGEVDDQ